MHLSLTSELKVMTIWISGELPLFNFTRLDILCAWIWPSCQKLWPFEFLENIRCSISSVSTYYAPESDLRVKSYDHLNFLRASVVQFRASRYIMGLNLTSMSEVMKIWISREFPLFNFERLDILWAWIWPPCQKLWSFEFLESFHCSISSVSIDYAPESDIRIKSYDHLNIWRASVAQFRASRYIRRLNLTFVSKVMTIWNFRELPFFQFRASRYIMRLNRTSEWKVMGIWISRELPLFTFERLDILWAWI